jgi:hypothetical protein
MTLRREVQRDPSQSVSAEQSAKLSQIVRIGRNRSQCLLDSACQSGKTGQRVPKVDNCQAVTRDDDTFPKATGWPVP